MGNGRGQQLLTTMIFNRDGRIPLSTDKKSMLKGFSKWQKMTLSLLIVMSTISLFIVDLKLRQLSDKRTRYFRSFAFSAAESEAVISSFDELKKVSFVASDLDVYKKLYFGWPFNTPTILVFQRDGFVFVTEDANYPQSLFESGKIEHKLSKFDIPH